MTIKAHIILCLSILIFLTGCNGDIFVDEYMPEGLNEIVISETDNNKEITFKSDKWSLINVYCEWGFSYNITAYTIDGEITYLPFEDKQLGMIHYKNEYIDVSVERKNGNKLKIILNENLTNDKVKMQITVGNSFKYENIDIQLAPTQKFNIDSVVYEWDRLETDDNRLKLMQYQNVNNMSNSPLTIGFYPYSKSTREIIFYDPTSVWKEDAFSMLLGTPLPEIIIPDIVDGKPVLNGTKIPFGIKEQLLATKLNKELLVDVTIDGFDTKKVFVYNLMRTYSVPYKVYMSNPKTGKKQTFSGKLSSSEPIDYLILKRALDEN